MSANSVDQHRFKNNNRYYIIGFAVFSAVFFSLMTALFFYELATNTSPYSSGGASATLQFFYNFVNGREFQTSLIASERAGASIGFTSNPFPYLHVHAIHGHVSPYIFAYIWKIFPNIYWLYGLVIFLNYAAMILFAVLVLKQLSPHSYKGKAVLAISLLLSSGILFTFQQHAQFLLFGAPFLIGLVYFFIVRNFLLYLVMTLLFILVSEDAAMVVITWSLYILTFEKKSMRFGITGGLLAFIYLVIFLVVIQPAARHYLSGAVGNTASVVVGYLFEMTLQKFAGYLIGIAPAVFFFLTYLMIWLFYDRPPVPWVKYLGLVTLPALPHWGQCMVVGAVHHLLPVVIFMFVALVLLIGHIPDIKLEDVTIKGTQGLTLCLVASVFVLSSMRILVSNIPQSYRYELYTYLGLDAKAHKIKIGQAEEKANKLIVSIVNSIPKNSSIAFLTNASIEGFIATRSNIWKFPDYYDKVDYIIIQPSAQQSFQDATNLVVKDFASALASLHPTDNDDGKLSHHISNLAIDDLVIDKRSHRILINTFDAVLLERIEKTIFAQPPSTLGLGWLSSALLTKWK